MSTKVKPYQRNVVAVVIYSKFYDSFVTCIDINYKIYSALHQRELHLIVKLLIRVISLDHSVFFNFVQSMKTGPTLTVPLSSSNSASMFLLFCQFERSPVMRCSGLGHWFAVRRDPNLLRVGFSHSHECERNAFGTWASETSSSLETGDFSTSALFDASHELQKDF